MNSYHADSDISPETDGITHRTHSGSIKQRGSTREATLAALVDAFERLMLDGLLENNIQQKMQRIVACYLDGPARNNLSSFQESVEFYHVKISLFMLDYCCVVGQLVFVMCFYV